MDTDTLNTVDEIQKIHLHIPKAKAEKASTMLNRLDALTAQVPKGLPWAYFTPEQERAELGRREQ